MKREYRNQNHNEISHTSQNDHHPKWHKIYHSWKGCEEKETPLNDWWGCTLANMEN